MTMLFNHRLAHIYRVDGSIFKSAHVHLDHGRLCVSLWLDAEEYETAIEALKECGWFCVDDEDNRSAWRSTKEGLGSPLWLHRNTLYPNPMES